MNIINFKVLGTPPTIFYIPDFITVEEESYIIKNVYSVPKPKWTTLSHRRLQDYGGIPHEKGMIPEKMPNWLQIFINKVDLLNIFDGRNPNQVLINEYLPGQGIMPHTDGPLFHPTIATISCGSHTILEFNENNEGRKKVCDILLEQRSLVVIKEDLYSKYLHSISNRTEDCVINCANLSKCVKTFSDHVIKRSNRVSLTIRNVPKVLKIKLNI